MGKSLISKVFYTTIELFIQKGRLHMQRCAWAKTENMIIYHDEEWGVPCHDDFRLFEFIVLNGAQAGLSWQTILNRRENYRLAFDNFNPALVAAYDTAQIERLLINEKIIRNRRKLTSAVNNAKVFLKIQQEYGSFDRFIWAYVNYQPIQNNLTRFEEMPAQTALSQQISTDLKQRGMTFVGPTIVYAIMQGIGMVNDHTVDCFRHRELGGKYDG
jgi:DNA-3-methyladenine glycosylase I